MFGIGFTEFMLILIVALIAIGPDKLPALAKALGKTYGELRKAGEELKKNISEAERDARQSGARQPMDGPSEGPEAPGRKAD